MKKQLLLFILPMLLFTATMHAQIKVIDFGAFALPTPAYTNLVDATTINNTCYSTPGVAGTTGNYLQNTFTLGEASPSLYNITWVQGSGTNDRLYSNNPELATYSASATAPNPEFTDYDSSKIGYISPNGTGSTGRRHWQVTIAAGETVTFMLASPGTPPTLSVTDDDGETWTSYTDPSFTTDNSFAFKITNSTAEQKTYKWYDGSGKVRLYRVYFADVNNAILGLDTKASPVSTNVQALGNRVYVSNVKSSSEISIYSITGALVKSFKTNSDTNFAFKSGLYIATVKTLEGQKSVKLLLN
jgi:hypothetical protein